MTTDDTPRPRKVPRWVAMLEARAIHHPLPPAEYARAVLDETVRAANAGRQEVRREP